MSKYILKEELEALSKIKGELRGASLKGDGEFVERRLGKEAVVELENEMKSVGFPIDYSELKTLGFYPLKLDTVNLVLMKRMFFSEEEMIELGAFLSKSSLVLRFFMKYFVSVDKVIEKAPEMWRQSYTKGNLKVTKYDRQGREIVVRIEDFFAHPLYCKVFEGYFRSVVKMILKVPVLCEETRCQYEGDKEDEFHFRW